MIFLRVKEFKELKYIKTTEINVQQPERRFIGFIDKSPRKNSKNNRYQLS